jgi:hypothetical protein
MRLVSVAFLLAFIAGCNTESPKNGASSPVAKWQAYKSKDQTFIVEFPSTPEPWETEFESHDYGHTDVYHVSTEFDEAMYGVGINDYPRVLTDAEATSELKNAYTLPDTGAEVLATTEIEMANIPAIEVISKTGPIYVVGRFFISDARRLYSLQVGSVRDPREDRELVDRFFQSFQLLESAGAEPVGETK